MNNAPYHSMLVEKMPSFSWRKPDIAAYLTTHNIPFNETLFKHDLLSTAKQHQFDETLKENGDTVLRLPP